MLTLRWPQNNLWDFDKQNYIIMLEYKNIFFLKTYNIFLKLLFNGNAFPA